jgi:hypothetical protein
MAQTVAVLTRLTVTIHRSDRLFLRRSLVGTSVEMCRNIREANSRRLSVPSRSVQARVGIGPKSGSRVLILWHILPTALLAEDELRLSDAGD